MRRVVALHGPGTLRPSESLDIYRAEVLKVLSSYGAVNPRVFGSVLHGTDTEASDLNLVLNDQPEFSGYELDLMRDELMNLLGFKVNIQPEEDLPDKIRSAVIAAARPL